MSFVPLRFGSGLVMLGDYPPEPLSAAEVRALLAACRTDRLTGAESCSAGCAVAGWAPCAEALALRPCDVDFSAGTIRGPVR